MNINEFISTYDLHDSLLEGLDFRDDILELDIDLCNWKQRKYNSNDDEMKKIKLVFSNVNDYIFDTQNTDIDSDTILVFECISPDVTSNMKIVKIIAEGDEGIKIIQFKSDNLEMYLD